MVGTSILLLHAVAFFGQLQPDPWLEKMNRGNQLRLAGDLAGAEQVYRDARTLAQQLGEQHPRIAQTEGNIAGIYQARGEYSKAEPLLLNALAILEKTLGPDHIEVSVTLHNLGLGYIRQGRFPEGEAAHLRAIRIAEKWPDGQLKLASTLLSLGIVYSQAGRTSDGESLIRRAVNIREKQLGVQHGAVAMAMAELAAVRARQGDLQDAERLFRHALAVAERTYGRTHPETARLLIHAGTLDYSRGFYSRAEKAWVRAIAVFENKSEPAANERLAAVRMSLGEMRRFEKRYADAEVLLAQAVDELQKIDNGLHPLLPRALNHLALTYADQEKSAAAERIFHQALAAGEELKKVNHEVGGTSVSLVLYNFGRLRFRQRRLTEAEILYRRSLDLAGPKAGYLRALLNDYARLLRDLKRGGEAKIIERRSQALPEEKRHSVDMRDFHSITR